MLCGCCGRVFEDRNLGASCSSACWALQRFFISCVLVRFREIISVMLMVMVMALLPLLKMKAAVILMVVELVLTITCTTIAMMI